MLVATLWKLANCLNVKYFYCNWSPYAIDYNCCQLALVVRHSHEFGLVQFCVRVASSLLIATAAASEYENALKY